MSAKGALRDDFDWDSPDLRALVAAALEEDAGAGDLTTAATVAPSVRARARLLAKQELILAGLPVAERVFRQLDPGLRFAARCAEGARAPTGAVIAELDGKACAILTGERTALNFLAHLTGVATLTRRFVAALAASGTRLRDTRKTTPLLRWLEKYAVRVGGGVNHRFSLSDGVLIKENHIAAAGGIAAAVRAAREAAAGPGWPVEIEVRNEAELRQALAAGPDEVLLDNFAPTEAARMVAIVRRERPGCCVELSGGITLENVAAFGSAGADFVSIGALTHSAPAADFSLLVEWAGVE
ncbi:MAG TPA: carboxylating nicotinate-nucleotide diphosphorylase [Candidatus Acidoferrales bacterium]|nr:carboxylating nicotinate-nucleotide diphosphorylase [Candidatus Acidoferrales bacterium]